MDQFISKVLSRNNIQGLADDFIPSYNTVVSKVGGILSSEILINITSSLKKENLNEVAEKIRESLNQAESASLQVAVIGDAGSGKSSFISALTGLHLEEGTAGAGTQRNTVEKKVYQHPKCSRVTFWHLSGTGTSNFTPDTYLKTADFDFFLIISSSLFSLNDAVLAQKIRAAGKQFWFVRTKVDIDVCSDEKNKLESSKKVSTLQQIQEDCLANLRRSGAPPQGVFLVCNFDLKGFDFPKLEEAVLKGLPAHKRYILALLWPSMSEASIDRKKAILKEKNCLDALQLAASASNQCVASPNRFDIHEQKKCFEVYRSYFGLDDKSIEGRAQRLGISVSEMTRNMKSLNFDLRVEEEHLTVKAWNSADTNCSASGGPKSSIFQFFKKHISQDQFLDKLAGDAKSVLKET